MLHRSTFISSKYYSMLAGGTITALFVTAVLMSDTFIAGLVLGESGVAGVNLVMPLYSLAAFFALMFAIGAPIMYSGQMGAFQEKDAHKTFGTGLLVTIVAGIVLLLMILFWGDIYLRFYNASPEIYDLAKGNLKWMKYVILLIPVNSLVAGMVFADGDESLSTLSKLISGVFNIILSVFLCRRIGIEGLGLASFMSLVLSSATLLIHFVKKSNSLRLNLHYSFETVKNIVKYSIVDAGTYLFIAVFTMGCNRLVLYYLGPDMIFAASVTILAKELQILFDGIGEAITPLISLYLGEGTYDVVREIWHHTKKTALLESILVTGLVLIFAPFIVTFVGVTDPQFKLLAYASQ